MMILSVYCGRSIMWLQTAKTTFIERRIYRCWNVAENMTFMIESDDDICTWWSVISRCVNDVNDILMQRLIALSRWRNTIAFRVFLPPDFYLAFEFLRNHGTKRRANDETAYEIKAGNMKGSEGSLDRTTSSSSEHRKLRFAVAAVMFAERNTTSTVATTIRGSCFSVSCECITTKPRRDRMECDSLRWTCSTVNITRYKNEMVYKRNSDGATPPAIWESRN